MIGTAVGHYRVTARLSEGGMGIVYRAEHSLLGKPAAIKVLHPELSTNRDIVQRFFNEAKATTSIRHVGIVEVFDFGYLESGHAYLVMELLEGEPLSAAIRRGRFGQTAALLLLRGVCSALIAAHAKGIVHRDLKPDNIFLIPDADSPIGVRPKLLDFGIAKLTDLTSSVSATRTGAVMGTPTYMSPEQCAGNREVDARADLYSLGCVLYELLCGRPPFSSQGAGELIGLHQYVAPESPRAYAPEISPQLERLVLSLLAKSPADRPQSATELVQRIDELARGGHLSGVAYELATNPGASLPRLGSQPGLLHTPAPHTPTPLRGPDAPTVATPYGLSVPSSPSLGSLGPTTLGAAAGVTSAGGPARSRGKVAAAVVAALGIAVVATVLLSREGPAPSGEPASGGSAPASAPASAGSAPASSPASAGSADTTSAVGADTTSAAGSANVAPEAVAPEGAGSGSAVVAEPGSGSKSDDPTPGDLGGGSAAGAEPETAKGSEPASSRRKAKPKPKPKTKGPTDVPTLIEDDI